MKNSQASNNCSIGPVCVATKVMGTSSVCTATEETSTLGLTTFHLYFFTFFFSWDTYFLSFQTSIFNCMVSSNWSWYLSLRGGLLLSHCSTNSCLTVNSFPNPAAGSRGGGLSFEASTGSFIKSSLLGFLSSGALSSSICLNSGIFVT